MKILAPFQKVMKIDNQACQRVSTSQAAHHSGINLWRFMP